jgi:hypothetical protein
MATASIHQMGRSNRFSHFLKASNSRLVHFKFHDPSTPRGEILFRLAASVDGLFQFDGYAFIERQFFSLTLQIPAPWGPMPEGATPSSANNEKRLLALSIPV